MLAWKSSKFIGGRKSKDSDSLEASRLRIGAAEEKLNLEEWPNEVGLECGSCEELGVKVRCEVCGFEEPL